jgi:hypothetical protein
LLGPPIAQREFGIRKQDYFVESWFRPAIAMTGFAIATSVLERFWTAHSLALFFLQVILVLPIAALGAWLVSLDDDERQWARAKLNSMLRSTQRVTSPS